MNHATTISPLMGKRTHDMSIAWEAPPSLQHRVVRNDAVQHDDAAPVWAVTMPADLEPTRAPEPFREPLQGLSVRDIDEPEVFNVFFGGAAALRRRAA